MANQTCVAGSDAVVSARVAMTLWQGDCGYRYRNPAAGGLEVDGSDWVDSETGRDWPQRAPAPCIRYSRSGHSPPIRDRRTSEEEGTRLPSPGRQQKTPDVSGVCLDWVAFTQRS